MLYALSLSNATYYKQFLTDSEAYLQCVYGDALGARWREVWCHHDGLACEAMPPPCPAICGDGVAGGDEECDQGDMAGKTCQDLGFAGGALGCKLDCTFDTSQCEPGEAPTTGDAPTTSGDPPVSSSDGSSETSPDSATAGGGGMGADPGCGCATDPASGAWLLGLAPLFLRRRRRDLDRHARAR